jgi:hypothetical protein
LNGIKFKSSNAAVKDIRIDFIKDPTTKKVIGSEATITFKIPDNDFELVANKSVVNSISGTLTKS